MTMPPPKLSLYALLEVTPEASLDDIKRAYRRLALLLHPDKQATRADGGLSAQEAAERFAAVAAAYTTLQDAAARRAYDLTGVCEGFDGGAKFNAATTTPITVEEIDAWAATYRNSPEERCDLREVYTQHKGNLKRILECLPLAEWCDVPRFRDAMRQMMAETSSDDNNDPQNRKGEFEAAKKSQIPYFAAFFDAKLPKGVKRRTMKAAKDEDSSLVLAAIRAKRTRGLDTFSAAIDALAARVDAASAKKRTKK